MNGEYWEESFELRSEDGSVEKTLGIGMNAGLDGVLKRAVKAYCPAFEAAGRFLLMAIAKQNREMFDAIKASIPSAFDAGAEVPVGQLVAAISARHNFPAVIEWLHDQGLDPTDRYPAEGKWEEIQPWREALIKGHLETIRVFASKEPELLTRSMPLVEDLIIPIALMCGNKRIAEALQLVEAEPELLDVICQYEGEAMDTPTYVDRLGHPDAATVMRSTRAAHSARLAIEEISAERLPGGAHP